MDSVRGSGPGGTEYQIEIVREPRERLGLRIFSSDSNPVTVVIGVAPHGPAARCGLQIGDQVHHTRVVLLVWSYSYFVSSLFDVSFSLGHSLCVFFSPLLFVWRYARTALSAYHKPSLPLPHRV